MSPQADPPSGSRTRRLHVYFPSYMTPVLMISWSIGGGEGGGGSRGSCGKTQCSPEGSTVDCKHQRGPGGVQGEAVGRGDAGIVR